MLKDIKNTIKQSAVYGISRIAAKSISFILLPLYTSIFTAQAVANINLLESFWQYLFTICLFSAETAIITFCAPLKDPQKEKQILFFFFIFITFSAIIFSLTGYLFSEKIAIDILKDITLKEAAYYCFLISAFEALLVIPLTIARLHSKAALYTTISILNLFINLSLQLYFILILKSQVEYIFIAKFVAPGIIVVLLLPYVIRYIKPYFSFTLLKEVLKFSFPLMLATLLAMLLNTVDRYILVDFVLKKDVGIYTIGYSIAGITNFLIVSPFVLAFNVISLRKINDGNAGRFFTKSATYLYLTMIFVSLVISFFIPQLLKVFIRNPELWASADIIRVILFSNCVASLYYISIQSYYIKKRTDIIFWVFLVCLSFNIIANYLLIPYLGIYASAILSVISYLLLIVISYNIAKKYYYIKFENYKLMLLSTLYILFTYVTFKLASENFALNLIISIGLLLIFPFLLYILKFYEPVELERIKGFFNKYLFKFNNNN